ncbi:MinD/ParA family protein [Candidatus Bathyarchaeota archaeon]|nr:MinD/ParA family protein [Candidatus Bathyarchaeota archaeon]
MRVIAIHSYRGGTGKSTTSANLASALAHMGFKVATVDLDLSSPGLHVIFNVSQSNLEKTLNDFIYQRCALKDCVTDLTEQLGINNGQLLFVGSSMKPEEISELMKKDYEESFYKQIAKSMETEFGVDYLIFDTHPGVVEDTILAVLSSDISLILMRMDRQDISGTFLLTKILRRMNKVCYVLLNMVPSELTKLPELTEDVSKAIQAPVLTFIPFLDDVLSYRSKGVFMLSHPTHQYSQVIAKVAKTLSKW